jgi:hypothetical protein
MNNYNYNYNYNNNNINNNNININNIINSNNSINDISNKNINENYIKDFIGYKNQDINNKDYKLCNECNLMHPLTFFTKSKKYCYNCWGWNSTYNFDLEYGKYIIDDINNVSLNEALDILKTVLLFYDNIDNKYKITDSIFNKIIHYNHLGILHNQFSKLLYKNNNLIFTGNKPVKIDYKNAVIYI